MTRTRLTAMLFAAGLVFVLAACGGGKKHSPSATSPAGATQPAVEENASPIPVTTPATGDEPFAGGRRLIEARPKASAPPALINVTTEDRGSYDRVVFEFFGDGLPGFRVEYFTPPTDCVSGDPVRMAGSAYLEATFTASARDPQGTPTVPQTDITPGLPSIAEAKQICDSGGTIAWYVGLNAVVDYRVLELVSPPRLVLDVAHP